MDLFTLSVSFQPHKQLETIVCIILHQVPSHKTCNTIVLDNVQMHPFLTPKTSMLIASHNAHLHTFTIAAPRTWLHGSIYKERDRLHNRDSNPSISIQIQDFQLTNKMCVTEDYLNFGCDATQLAIVLDNASIFKAAKGQALGGRGVVSTVTVGKFPSPGTTVSTYMQMVSRQQSAPTASRLLTVTLNYLAHSHSLVWRRDTDSKSKWGPRATN